MASTSNIASAETRCGAVLTTVMFCGANLASLLHNKPTNRRPLRKIMVQDPQHFYKGLLVAIGVGII